MPDRQDQRQRLLAKLSRSLLYSAPLVLASAGGVQAASDDASPSNASGIAAYQLAAAQPEAKGEAEARKGKAEARGEAEAEAEGKGEAEAEAESSYSRKDITRPKGSTVYRGDQAALAARGRTLFSDTSLSTNGLSCNSCHEGLASYADTFKTPYPHFVQMGKDMFGLQQVTTEQMVQLCMVSPMAAKPLAWDSVELAALSAYVDEVQKAFARKK
ncbi:MAG: c-type cytochrome [Pseudomonadota bacterium]